MSQTATLRSLIQSPDLLVMPGIFDGFSARLVEHSGFAAGFISGAGLSETLLGYSDVGLMGFELNLAAVTRLVACCTLPLLADADTGYGNAVNVYHTARAFEQAGVAGLMIEDQTWPKRCGHMQGKEVIPAEEMVEKVHATCDARRDPAFIVMARTDAFATHGLPEVLHRLAQYAEAGADLLFADALVSEHDIATVARHVPKPLCVNMGFGIRSRATTPLLAPAQLQALGVAVVIYPRLLTACAVQGMKHGIAALRDAMQSPTVLERPELAVSFEELNALVGFAELQARERRYTLPPESRMQAGEADRTPTSPHPQPV